MENPFYLQEIPVDAPFCNRREEIRELTSFSRAKANVLIYSPRRYGKTSDNPFGKKPFGPFSPSAPYYGEAGSRLVSLLEASYYPHLLSSGVVRLR